MSVRTGLRLRRLLFSYGYITVFAITSAISIPIFLRSLGNEAFGVWITATSVASYFAFFSFGIAQTTAVLFGEAHHTDRSHARVVVATGFWKFSRQIIVPTAVTVVGTCLHPLTGTTTMTFSVASFAALLFLLQLPFTTIGACLRAVGGIEDHQAALIAQQLLRLGAGLLVVLTGRGVVELLLVMMAIDLLTHGLMWLSLRRRVLGVTLAPSARDARVSGTMSRPSAHYFILQVAGSIAFALDPIIVSVVLGSSAVANFAVAQRVVTTFSGLSAAVTNVFIPELVQQSALGRAEAARRTFRRASLLSVIFGATCLGPLLWLGRPLIDYWVGGRAVADSGTFGALLAFLAIQSVLYPLDAVAIWTMQHERYARVVVAEAALNLVLSVLLARWLGVAGVVVGTLIGRLVLGLPVLLWTAREALELQFRESLAAIVFVAPAFLASSSTAFVLAPAARGSLLGAVAALVASVAVFGGVLLIAPRRRSEVVGALGRRSRAVKR
jgi:O-antigen/teichoic acid export membrane protein